MDTTIKADWVDALRSGRYSQGQVMLNNKQQGTFCCLGVLCEMAVEAGVIERDPDTVTFPSQSATYYGVKRDYSSSFLPEAVQEWAGINSVGEFINDTGSRDSLVDHNDNGKTFRQIADIIEKEF